MTDPRLALPSSALTFSGDARLWPEQQAWAFKAFLWVAALMLYPWFATPFFVFQIGAQTLVLGTIALSLTFLAGYGGMVSLSQMSVAGIAAYMVAIVGTSSVTQISLGWTPWLAVIVALVVSVIAAVVIGALAIRTEGIRTLMISLAIGVAFFYLTQQNYSLFNGFQGFSGIEPPMFFQLDTAEPRVFYYVALAVAALSVFAVIYIARSPFGIGLQGVRDNPRRMASLGFDVTLHRLAAHAIAGLIAGAGGVLFAYYNHRVSPGSISTAALINVLVIAVLGGMRHPVGPYIGAALFVLLGNFAIDFIDRERFNLVIGSAFLLVILFSPDGLLGLWERLRNILRPVAQREQDPGATSSTNR